MALARAELMAPWELMAGMVLPRPMGGGGGRSGLQRLARTALPNEAFLALVAVVAGRAMFRGLMPPSLESGTPCTPATLLMGCASLSVASRRVLVTLAGGAVLRLLGGRASF
jgi:hypothetical protein